MKTTPFAAERRQSSLLAVCRLRTPLVQLFLAAAFVALLAGCTGNPPAATTSTAAATAAPRPSRDRLHDPPDQRHLQDRGPAGRRRGRYEPGAHPAPGARGRRPAGARPARRRLPLPLGDEQVPPGRADDRGAQPARRLRSVRRASLRHPRQPRVRSSGAAGALRPHRAVAIRLDLVEHRGRRERRRCAQPDEQPLPQRQGPCRSRARRHPGRDLRSDVERPAPPLGRLRLRARGAPGHRRAGARRPRARRRRVRRRSHPPGDRRRRTAGEGVRRPHRLDRRRP